MYAVGVDPYETIELLEDTYGEGYPWPMALPGPSMLPSLRIFQRSTKLAFDAEGVIVYRKGYSQGNAEDWRNLFRQLASN